MYKDIKLLYKKIDFLNTKNKVQYYNIKQNNKIIFHTPFANQFKSYLDDMLFKYSNDNSNFNPRFYVPKFQDNYLLSMNSLFYLYDNDYRNLQLTYEEGGIEYSLNPYVKYTNKFKYINKDFQVLNGYNIFQFNMSKYVNAVNFRTALILQDEKEYKIKTYPASLVGATGIIYEIDNQELDMDDLLYLPARTIKYRTNKQEKTVINTVQSFNFCLIEETYNETTLRYYRNHKNFLKYNSLTNCPLTLEQKYDTITGQYSETFY